MLFNVITRSSGRPNYFAKCVASVRAQKGVDVNHVVGVDDGSSWDYALKEGVSPIMINRINRRSNFGIWSAPYNLYFNYLYRYCVSPGYVVFLDDDDIFCDEFALHKIALRLQNEPKALVIWKVSFPGGRTVPSYSFGKQPCPRDISGIGFAFSTEMIWAAQWDEVKEADFRVAHKLSLVCSEIVWVDQVLSRVQRTSGMGGFGRQDDM